MLTCTLTQRSYMIIQRGRILMFTAQYPLTNKNYENRKTNTLLTIGLAVSLLVHILHTISDYHHFIIKKHIFSFVIKKAHVQTLFLCKKITHKKSDFCIFSDLMNRCSICAVNCFALTLLPALLNLFSLFFFYILKSNVCAVCPPKTLHNPNV